MLVSGSPNRSTLLGDYGRLVARGTPSLAAWHQVFKDENHRARVEALRRPRVAERLPLPLQQEHPDGQELLVARLRRRCAGGAGRPPAACRRIAETAARFEKAIALRPVSARALALYGLLRLDEDQPDKALPLLKAAAKDKTDWLVQYHVATGLTRVITTTDDPDPA